MKKHEYTVNDVLQLEDDALVAAARYFPLFITLLLKDPRRVLEAVGDRKALGIEIKLREVLGIEAGDDGDASEKAKPESKPELKAEPKAKAAPKAKPEEDDDEDDPDDEQPKSSKVKKAAEPDEEDEEDSKPKKKKGKSSADDEVEALLKELEG
jgi:outer membrane biosynthesis protein TonB